MLFLFLTAICWDNTPALADVSEPPVTLKVGYTEFQPYSFTDEDGVPSGYSLDLIRHLAGRSGYALDFVATSNPAELMQLLADGEIDMTSLLAVTGERGETGLFTQPIGAFTVSLFVRRGSNVRTLSDVSGAKIGVVEGSFGAQAAGAVEFAEVVAFSDDNALVVALLSGTVDAIATPTEMFQATLRRLGVEDRVRLVTPPITERARAFLVSRTLPGLMAELDDAIANALPERENAVLFERWFGRPETVFNDPRYFWISVSAGILAICLGIALWVAASANTRARKSFADSRDNRHLIDALNGIDVAVIIYDRDLKAVHWNDGVIRCLPSIVALLRKGATLPELAFSVHTSGATLNPKSEAEARKHAHDIVAALREGRCEPRIVPMSNGTYFEVQEFAIGAELLASVHKDVSLVGRQTREIREQKEALREANVRLAAFSSLAAHDLQAPLRQQKLLLQFVEEGLDGIMPPAVKDDLDMVRATMSSMDELVQDLLVYARAGTPGEGLSTFSSEERLKKVISLSGVAASFRVEVAEGMPMVTGDATAFDTVMRNLISNAVKHHDRDAGVIRIRGMLENDTAVFEVEDDGPGIPEAHRARIFEPFTRLKPKGKSSGSGLGLAFIQRTVESWGGSVDVSSPGPRGSLFRFTMPAPHEARLSDVALLSAHSSGGTTARRASQPGLMDFHDPHLQQRAH